jgi:hypothetical protein
MGSKILLVLWGESFRSGGQMTRTRGTGKYFEKQKWATSSHVELLDFIKKEYSCDSDILLNSFSLNPEDDQSLISWYSDYCVQNECKFIYNLHEKAFSTEQETRRDTYSKVVDIIDDYEYVLFVRLDLRLKQYFIDNFYFDCEKIIFAHIDLNLGVSSVCKNQPNMWPTCEQIMLFAKKFFYTIKEKIIDTGPHEVRNVLIQHDKNLINHIDYFVHTLHLSSTDLQWNPLYFQVGRNKNGSYDNSNVRKHKGDIDIYYDVNEYKFKLGSNWEKRYRDIPRDHKGRFID